jgi:dienelactone hydrolase
MRLNHFSLLVLASAVPVLGFAQFTSNSTDVTILQGSVSLPGKAYAPSSLPSSPVPVIVVLPGGGADITSVAWAGQRLASAGYIAILVKPQFGSSVTSYASALQSAITFAGTTANPYRSVSDTSRIGGAGWSLGARALTLAQQDDPRLKAIVAWDNLATVETGDQGSPSGGFNPDPSTYRTPKVPALGLASDATGYSTDPEIKKTAFNWWVQNRVPSMEVVFRESNHFWWSGRATPWQSDVSAYFTVAWFDKWLKGDKTAAERLLTKNVLGTPFTDLLSTKYTSAASFDRSFYPDLRKMR